MTNEKIVLYGATVVLCLGTFQAAGLMGWSLPVTIGVLLALLVVFNAVHIVWQRWTRGWILRYNRMIQRVQAGDAESLHQELTARYAAGSRTFDTLMGLVLASSYLERFAEAQPFADEARALVEQKRLCTRRDIVSRYTCDLVLYGQFDLAATQGRFSEAAHSLRPRVPDAASPNYMAAIIAWGFFLADDLYNARVVLDNVEPVGKPRDFKRYITPDYQFMVAYMRRVLFGEDTRAQLAELSDRFAHWEDQAAHHTTTPYGARLRAILDDIRPLLPDLDE